MTTIQPETIISLRDISQRWDNRTVLDNINFDVHQGDFIAITGPNGGGKTTLIKIILGLLKPASGTVRFYKNEKEVHIYARWGTYKKSFIRLPATEKHD